MKVILLAIPLFFGLLSRPDYLPEKYIVGAKVSDSTYIAYVYTASIQFWIKHGYRRDISFGDPRIYIVGDYEIGEVVEGRRQCAEFGIKDDLAR